MAVKQNRNAYGEKIGTSKLREEDIINIRKLYKPYKKNFNTCSFAKKYRVDQATIWNIVNHETWKHSSK